MSGWPDIASLVPHAGSMCLLERIVAADSASIVCGTMSHRSITNPLRLNEQLSALHLAEYGSQAMAAHGSLMRSDDTLARQTGMLVSLKEFELLVDRLDDQPDELLVTARRRLAQTSGLIYDFAAVAGGQLLGRGRVQVLFTRDQ